jgi:hypothetical protein
MFMVLSFLAYLSQATYAAEYKARYCEFFVDRATPFRSKVETQKLAVYLKVALKMLDGPVARVGFLAAQFSDDRNDRKRVLSLIDIPGEQFFNDAYWKVVFSLDELESKNVSAYRGDFYIETVKGTTLFVASDSREDLLSRIRAEKLANVSFAGGYFLVIDHLAFFNMLDVLEGVSARLTGTSNYQDGPTNGLSSMHSSVAYLNPNQCR